MLKIGSTVLEHGLMLAPMAGYTDHAMRVVTHECGSEYSTTEMVSAKAVCYNDKKTPLLARILPEEGPCALQIFGSEPEFMAEAAARLADGAAGGLRPVAIDVNAGCPVPKVAGNGEGSALMRDPKKLYAILSAIVARVALPVTVKIRAGWDAEHINAPEVARAAEAAGVSLIAVHGRTRTAMYSGKADRAVIAAVKQAVNVPVVANGDITDVASALSMLGETGADGLMIGRGCLSNPFLFREIAAALSGKTVPVASREELYALVRRQLHLRIADKGEEVAVRESRKQIAAFIRGFPDASSVRAEVYAASTALEMEKAFEAILQN